jgi:hypothetical protein
VQQKGHVCQQVQQQLAGDHAEQKLWGHLQQATSSAAAPPPFPAAENKAQLGGA